MPTVLDVWEPKAYAPNEVGGRPLNAPRCPPDTACMHLGHGPYLASAFGVQEHFTDAS